MTDSIYGKELILDLCDCNASLFNRRELKKFFTEMCHLLEMEKCKLTFWDYFWWPDFLIRYFGWDKDDRIYGTSAVQFIKTSNITLHTINNLKRVYLNIFSCKNFDEEIVADFTKNFFQGKNCYSKK